MSERAAGSSFAGVEDLLDRFGRELRRWIQRDAGSPLLRFEDVDDLLQGVRLHVLRAATRFELRSDAEAVSWLRRTTKRYLADRRAHWFALRRGGGQLLRRTLEGDPALRDLAPQIVDSTLGPRSRADRREQILRLSEALGLLLPRDRSVVQWVGEGATLADLSERLGISMSTAHKVRTRAFERLRRAWKVLERYR